jgi:dihydroorotase-like cyclic amidohydrolase
MSALRVLRSRRVVTPEGIRPASIHIGAGQIAVGADADLVVFADAERWRVTPDAVQHRHKVTPYAGEALRGVVHATYLNGRKIAERGRLIADDLGELIQMTATTEHAFLDLLQEMP